MSQSGSILNSSGTLDSLIIDADVGTASPLASTLIVAGGAGILTSAAGNTLTITSSVSNNTLTGNSGGAISPVANNWDLLGSGSVTIAGTAGTLTTQLTGLTNHAVQVGAGTDTLTQLAIGTNGQVLIGSTGADPKFSTLTSVGGTITFTPGAGTLNLESAATGAGTITGDSGGALSQTANNWNILGSGSITTSGAVSTLTVQLTGLTNHNVLIGAGTSTITNVAPSATSGVALISQGAAADPTFGTVVVAGGGTGAVTLTGVLTGNGTSAVTANAITQYAVVIGGASNAVASTAVGSAGQVLQSSGAGVNPAYSTATYPLTTTINQVLYSSAANTVVGLATANRAVMTTTAAGVPVMTALATDGQLIIGSTAGAPAAASLTAGANITITPGSNSITIASTASGGMTWSEEVASPVSAAVNHGYVANLGTLLTFNLPGTFAVGDIIAIVGKGAGLWVIDAPAGDTIHFGSSDSSSGGTVTATNRYDCIEIIGTVADTEWTVRGSIGNFTVA